MTDTVPLDRPAPECGAAGTAFETFVDKAVAYSAKRAAGMIPPHSEEEFDDVAHAYGAWMSAEYEAQEATA